MHATQRRASTTRSTWSRRGAPREGVDCDLVKGGDARRSRPRRRRCGGFRRSCRASAHGASERLAGAVAGGGARSRRSGLPRRAVLAALRAHPSGEARARAGRGRRAARVSTIFEETPVTEIRPGVAVTSRGDVRARWVVRATEGYTAGLAGRAPHARADELGDDRHRAASTASAGTGGETHARRLARVLLPPAHGGRAGRDRRARRPVPVRVGDRPGGRDRAAHGRRAAGAARAAVPVAVATRASTTRGRACWAWRATGARRSASTAPTGVAWAGGYVGRRRLDVEPGRPHAARPAAGRRLGAHARCRGSATAWRRWEPEPLRWLGIHGVYGLYRRADGREERTGRPSRLAAVADRVAGR